MTSESTITMAPSRNFALLPILYFAFALSGFSALVYQVTWQRLLGLFSGSDSISSSIVVGSFLLGLGLGSLLAGCFADRIARHRAFVYFAWCEIGIACFGLASKPLYYDFIFKQLTATIEHPVEIFTIVFVSLLIPTLLMGLSLPILSRAIVNELANAPKKIGFLYGINTLGAATGAAMSGWWMIGAYGYETTIQIASGVNLLVGIIIWALSPAYTASLRAETNLPTVTSADKSHSTREESGSTTEMFWHWCVFMFFSGFLAISLEIVWFRLLGVILHGSPYGFSLVLAIFLVGDALGIILAAYWAERIRYPRVFFIRAQAIVALYSILAILVIYWAYGNDTIFSYLQAWTTMHSGQGYIYWITILALTLFLVFPPAVFMGLSFPVVHKAIQNDTGLVARRVGFIQLANIIGNTAGSILTGLVIFAFLGTADALVIAVTISIMLMLLLIVEQVRYDRGPSVWKSVVLTVSLAVVAWILPSEAAFWTRLHFCTWAKKVSVHEDHTGVALLGWMGKDYHILSINGRQQGYVPFSKKHIYCSIFSLLHPNPQDILLIGFGTGGQAYTLGLNPTLQHAQVVELINPVYLVMRDLAAETSPEAQGIGALGVKQVLEDPRFRYELGDGRRTLFSSTSKYDIIQNDAFVPTESHSGLLFSIEFFQQIRNKLKPGGLAIEWAPTERTRTGFLRVFPYVTQIGPLPDLGPVLIGSEHPLPFDLTRFLAKIQAPAVSEKLRQIHVSPEEIIAMIEAAPVTYYTPENKPALDDYNTDLFPKDEFFLNNPVQEISGKATLLNP